MYSLLFYPIILVSYRKDFMKKLGPEVEEEEVLKDMKEVVELMAANIDTINEFYLATGQDAKTKV